MKRTVAGVVAVVLAAGGALVGCSTPAATVTPQRTTVVEEIASDQEQLRQRLATAWAGIPAESQAAACADWLAADDEQRYELYLGIIEGVEVEPYDVSLVFPAFFESECR
jgi:outer membrane murein-binding lipoprotein Lpp